MKCLIIEDEIPAQEILLEYIGKTPNITCVGTFQSAVNVPLDLLKEVNFVFLDIQLPGINGLDFWKNLESTRPEVIITTAYREYAIDAFNINVVDYLLKPYSYERFLKSVYRIASKNGVEKKEEEQELFIYINKTFHKIFIDNIIFIEGQGDYIKIVTITNELLTNDSINNFEKKLGSKFVRVHKSFLINFSKISKIEGNLILINNFRIPTGRKYRKDFFKMIKT